VGVTIHDHIAELRARLAELEAAAESLPVPDDAPVALSLAAMAIGGDVFLAGEQLEAIAALATPPAIAESAPALESWRRSVLENPRAYSKRDQAAAWELTALECERSGNTHGAERARREAGWALGVRGAA
jgi:hypothetical protein